MFAVLLKMLPIFIFALPGVIAFVLYPGLEGDQTRNTFVLLLNNLLPPGLRGLVLSSLVAALVTSLIAVLNSVSTLVVRDFVVPARPDISERGQVQLGRLVILLVTLLGIGAAYMVYKNEEGLYKYLQTITAYLVVPVFPAIFFGVVSKKVTFTGAKVSVLTGILLSGLFVSDQFMGAEDGQRLFPFLHYPLTLNFGYRGLWATLIITAVLFLVSSFTEKTDPARLAKTTMDYSKKPEPFQGWQDWRFQLAALSAITIGLIVWLS
jgi:SSS family solute:Na+ symporter